MIDSHNSLRDDFETSTPQMNAAVATAISTPGVFDARMTGGGFVSALLPWQMQTQKLKACKFAPSPSPSPPNSTS